MFEDIPVQADACILKRVIHDWPDELDRFSRVVLMATNKAGQYAFIADIVGAAAAAASPK